MEKATCNTYFTSTLHAIYLEGITTQSALMANQQLYSEFWFALDDFVHFALLSTSNRAMIDKLEKGGVTTREDLESECRLKINNKLERVLQQPIEKQYNYCYTIANNLVIDRYRSFIKPKLKIVSIDDEINRSDFNAGALHNLASITGDDTYNPERLVIERESIYELQQMLKMKEEVERTKNKEIILREVALLSKHPAEVLVRLACTHLNMKCRELASLIIDKGYSTAYAEVLKKVSKKSGIELSTIRGIIAEHELTPESVKAETNSKAKVAAQISRLIYRADDHLSK